MINPLKPCTIALNTLKMRQFKEILKLQLDFSINQLKTLHKIKKLHKDLDKSNNNNKIT